MLAGIRSARSAKNLTPAELMKLTDTAARLLALRHRLEVASDMLETRIIAEHPRWMALKRTMSTVLGGCPRCSKLMLEALTRLDV